MKRPLSIRIAPRCLVWLVPLLLLGAKPAAAEPGEPRADRKTVTVTTHVLAPFFDAYYLDANLRVSDTLVVLLNTSFLSLDNDDWKTHTGTVGAGLSYFWQGDALRRWYVEAFSELMLSSWRHGPSGKTAPVVPGFTVGSAVGYRWAWALGPVLDLGAGAVMLHFPSARVEGAAGPVSSKALTKVYPTVKVNVGWAF